ncbi:hypothetical protein ACTWP5_25530 [Streptomyces sp. 4N509B]|uniref:hypothetical protein n=1 Tax=Streptomyces sp. 4N509B TaxID=3457413 RepID=UPI003FD6B94A
MSVTALVNERGRSGAPDAGVTRRPDEREGAVGRTVRGARVARAVPGSGSFRVGTTTGSVNEGCSRPATGRPWLVGRPPLAMPIDEVPSRTEWDSVPTNEGFWNVAIRPVNPASATPRPVPSARWIGGIPAQATGTAAPPDDGGGGDGALAPASAAAPASSPPAPAPAPASPSVRPRPLNLSRNPTPQPSVPARVTRDAMCSA